MANQRAESGCQDGEARRAALEPLGILLKYFWGVLHLRILQLTVLRSFSTPAVSPHGLMLNEPPTGWVLYLLGGGMGETVGTKLFKLTY